jgi:hypothetical protein
MRGADRTKSKYTRRSLILIVPTLTVTAVVAFTPGAPQDETRPIASVTQTVERPARNNVPDSKAKALTIPNSAERKNKRRIRRDSNDRAPSRRPNEKRQEARKKRAVSMLEDVLASTDRITPAEYRFLAEVEGATLLWSLDRERALSLLKKTSTGMRGLLDEERESKSHNPRKRSKRQRLWFLALRRIAALNPDLIKNLLVEDSSADNSKSLISGDWTDEARAIMSVASDRIEKDPKAAARLAEKSLAFGLVDWMTFLERLSKRDAGEAERLAIMLITRLRDCSVSPIALENLQGFVLAQSRPSKLKEYFFQSILLRLRRDIRPDAPERDLKEALIVARAVGQVAAAEALHWQPEFNSVVSTIETLFAERALPIPGAPRRRTIDVSSLGGATLGDNQDIRDALPRIAKISDSGLRDKEYRALAAQAALKADAWLADDILSKISDEETRRAATLAVYSPFVRKAIQESDWAQAQRQAFKIQDPLGFTLVIESITGAMLRSGEDKNYVQDIYDAAVTRLRREKPSEKLARAFLLSARALSPIDRERSLDAVKFCVGVLNKSASSAELLGESTEPAIEEWVGFTNFSVNPDESIDLIDLLASTFIDIARRDVDDSLLVADGLTHEGLYSLARLAICRALLQEGNKSSRQAKSKRVASE